MKPIFLSSTFKDLVAHRAAVAAELVRIRWPVLRMEDNTARAEHTRAACEADVDACGLYLGLFAWRYGHVPADDNPQGLSITELEYRHARAGKKPCLIFLLDDAADWPAAWRDSHTGDADGGGRIAALRAELGGCLVGRFSTPENAAREVLAALSLWESTRRAQRLRVMGEIKTREHLGQSYLADIQARFERAGTLEIVEIRLGPTPWWSTRLHLVAALAVDFTRIRQFVFVERDGRFAAMATPAEVRRALSRRQPALERAYQAARPLPVAAGAWAPPEIEHIVNQIQAALCDAFGGVAEEDIQQSLGDELPLAELALEATAQVLDTTDRGALQLQADIARCHTPYVVLVDPDQAGFRLVDRLNLVSRLARGELAALGV